MTEPLIDCNALIASLQDPNIVIVDCRYDLVDTERGRRNYLASHIPGAVYADVHDDLSGPPVTDCGRHPLPTPAAQSALFRRLGINDSSDVVVYDDMYGAFAGRLWWMLRYMGHTRVAVLNGGWQHWLEGKLPVESGAKSNNAGHFKGQPNHDWLVTVDQLAAVSVLIDSRDPVRYRGEAETIDKAAGHIPGARNHFWKNNLNNNGLFKDSATVRETFLSLFAGTPSEEAVFYCGSGVTACHNLVAAVHAGLPLPRLYAGSWSEWCSDPGRQIATGEE